jgi:hypothetical protein
MPGDATLVEHQHVVGIEGGKGEIVQRHDDDRAAPCDAPYLDQYAVLVLGVERGRRLVEEQHRGFAAAKPFMELRMRFREGDSLALAARQRRHDAAGQLGEVGRREGSGDRRRIVRRPRRARMGDAPERDHVPHEVAERAVEMLRHRSAELGEPAGRLVGQDGRAKLHRSVRRRRQAGNCPEQSGLAGTVGPEDRQEPAPRRPEADLVDEPPPGARDGEALHAQRHAAVPLWCRRRPMNKGAPTRLVTMPVGSSAGATTVRAAASARMTSTAPRVADAGRT